MYIYMEVVEAVRRSAPLVRADFSAISCTLGGLGV